MLNGGCGGGATLAHGRSRVNWRSERDLNQAKLFRYKWPGRLASILAAVALFATFSLAQSKDEKASSDNGNTSRLRVEVTGGEKSVPVDMASVYVKFIEKRVLAKDQKMEMDVKTNRDGIAVVPSVPRGKITLQVVAKGWKPFGQNYELAQEQEILKIHLDRPPKWY